MANDDEPVILQVGVPVAWTIIAEEGTLTNYNGVLVITEYGIEQELQYVENVITFTSTIGYSYWMNKVQSEIILVDELEE